MKFYKVQGLRAIAALLVVLDHSLTMIPESAGGGHQMRPIAWFIGEQGVAAFFVISGFIMSYKDYETGSWRYGAAFFSDRARRIVPLYWIFTIVSFVLISNGIWLKGRGVDAEDFFKSLFFIPYGNGAGALRPVLGPGWTLNYEMFFYLLFSISMLIPRNCGVYVLIALMMILSSVGVFFGKSIYGNEAETLFEFYTSPHLILFAAGIVIAQFSRMGKIPSFKFSYAVPVVAFALSAVIFVIAINEERIPLQWRLLFWALDALLVVMCIAAGGRKSENTLARKIEYLGDASFSIYLTHLFSITVSAKIFSVFQIWDNPVLFIICSLFLSSVVGVASYNFVERPILKFGSKKLKKSRSSAPLASG